MKKITPQSVKESYERLKKGKTGLHLEIIKQCTLELYQACQNAKLN